tara:strand:- start:540 stop:1283 length:744 start_codon:yes stop_codon:yes gene_type:complete
VDEVATDHAAVLGRKLAALRDPVLRLGWAEDLLRRLSLDRAVALLGASLGEPGRDPQQDDLFLNLTLVLVQPALEERRRAIGAQALLHGPAEIGWLFGHRPDEGPAPAPQPVPDHGRGRPITLGERKSLARGRDRQLLARVIRDPHPDVVSILLANPALIESDVRRLASRRPVDPEILRQILAQPRWAIRYEVRLAIAQNPHLPIELAVALGALLRRSDARTLAAAPDLRPALREVCRWVATPATTH